jgi:ketosteroid isomerase-like protein
MDSSATVRQVTAAYFERLERRDWDGFAELIAEDVVYEMPQSRERIRGKAAYLQFNQEYPGDWHLDVRRLVCEERFAAAWIDARVGEEWQDACVWLEVSDDNVISRVVDYWPEPYEPPPGRAHLVERW